MLDRLLNHERVEDLFEAARNLNGSALHEYLERECGHDQDLRSAVQTLLRAGCKEGLLDRSPNLDQTCEGDRHAERTRVGRYKLLQKIGEGGFGVVYMAEQNEPVHRKVALKLIKPGMDSKQVIARFEAERQALAMMDHPNIARVLDAGTTDEGRPYFVMELVRGIEVTEFCDKRQLSTNDRLNLFSDVCLAVHHAHQKGVIHRDLKPSNVLVSLHDGKPIVKVIDFGIARALHQKLTDRTLFTRFGEMIGTPQYMSPEQAELGGLDVDTRSDIYSLGVLLYELLTGSPPIMKQELVKVGLAELRRLIERDVDRPSARISTATEVELAEIAARRSVDPVSFRTQLAGDLDWIVIRSLEKDRERRYASAYDLAEDVSRFLNDELIEARPPATSYRVHKFVRRNRVLVATTAAVVATLLLGIFASSGLAWQLANKNEESKRNELAARDASEEAKAKSNALEQQLYAANVAQAGNALQVSNKVVAADHLSRCPERFRDWEWHRLTTELTTRHVTVLPDTRNPEFLPDGTLVTLGVGGRDGKLYFWEKSTFQSSREIASGLNDLSGLAIDPSGENAAVTARDGTVSLIELANGQQIWSESIGKDLWTSAVSYSDDGERLFVIAGGIHRWDAKTGAHRVFQPSEGATGRESAITGEHLLVTSHEYDHFPLWTYDASSLKKLGEFTNFGLAVHAVAMAPDGKRMACGGADGRVTIRSVPDGEVKHLLGPHNEIVYSISFSPDGKTLATSSTGLVVLWDGESGVEKHRILNDYSHIYGISFSPDSQFLAIYGERFGGADATTVYDVGLLGTAPCASDTVVSRSENYDWWTAEFSPNGRYVATTGADQAVDIWDANSRKLKHRWYGHAGAAAGFGWSSDEETLYAIYYDGQLQAIEVPSGKVRWRTNVGRVEEGAMFDLVQSRDGTRLYVGTSDEVVVVDSKNGTIEHRLAGGKSLDVSPDEELLAVSRDATGKTAVIYDRTSLRELKKLERYDGNIRCVRFSPDGSLLASTSLDRTARIWDVETGKCKHVLQGHINGVWSCEFSKSGKRLFSADGLGRLIVWDVETGREVYRIEDFTCPFFDLSPDGNTLAAAGKELCFIASQPLSDEAMARRNTVQLAKEAIKVATKESLWAADKAEFIRKNDGISGDVRAAALDLLRVVGDDPYELYRWSWNVLLGDVDSDWRKAGMYIATAVKTVPDWAEYRLAAGLASYRLAQFQEAELHLNKAIDLNPVQTFDHLDYLVDLRSGSYAILAMLKHKVGHDEEAVAYLNKALDLEQHVPDELSRLKLHKIIREAEEMLETEKAD